jgi:hypothetical protein
LLSLRPGAVDVGGEDDIDRNWAAPANCTVTPLAGDMHSHLDIYVDDTVPGPPTEAIAAAWLAERLRTVVAYEAVPSPPSAYWLVGPDGRRTRARIYEEDSDVIPVYRIDAVEHPLAALPGLHVAPLPEVIHSYRMPTPLTDRFREGLIAEKETSAGTTARDVTTRLGAWEAMVTRLSEGWPPDGWYPAEYYREDLTTRDELEAAPDALPEALRSRMVETLSEVDRRFAEATEDDGGEALTAVTGPLPTGRSGNDDHWWWRRIPHSPPWRNTPGRPARMDETQ